MSTGREGEAAANMQPFTEDDIREVLDLVEALEDRHGMSGLTGRTRTSAFIMAQLCMNMADTVLESSGNDVRAGRIDGPALREATTMLVDATTMMRKSVRT